MTIIFQYGEDSNTSTPAEFGQTIIAKGDNIIALDNSSANTITLGENSYLFMNNNSDGGNNNITVTGDKSYVELGYNAVLASNTHFDANSTLNLTGGQDTVTGNANGDSITLTGGNERVGLIGNNNFITTGANGTGTITAEGDHNQILGGAGINISTYGTGNSISLFGAGNATAYGDSAVINGYAVGEAITVYNDMHDIVNVTGGGTIKGDLAFSKVTIGAGPSGSPTGILGSETINVTGSVNVFNETAGAGNNNFVMSSSNNDTLNLTADGYDRISASGVSNTYNFLGKNESVEAHFYGNGVTEPYVAADDNIINFGAGKNYDYFAADYANHFTINGFNANLDHLVFSSGTKTAYNVTEVATAAGVDITAGQTVVYVAGATHVALTLDAYGHMA